MKTVGGSNRFGVRVPGLPLDSNNTVPWPSGKGSCPTNRRATVRVRPGLLFAIGANPLGAGHVRKTCLLEFESQWRLCHGPSVQSGVDAALSRQRSPVQIRYGSLFEVGSLRSEFETTVRYANGRAACLRNKCLWVRIPPAPLRLILSAKCTGSARDSAKVEDQVRFLAWTLKFIRLASVMDSHDCLRNS